MRPRVPTSPVRSIGPITGLLLLTAGCAVGGGGSGDAGTPSGFDATGTTDSRVDPDGGSDAVSIFQDSPAASSDDSGTEANAPDAPAPVTDAAADVKGDAAVDATGDVTAEASSKDASDGGQPDAPPPDATAHDAGIDAAAHDGGSDTGGGTLDAGACTLDHLVISQVQSRGLAGGNDEFIDLYNPTSATVTLDATWAIDARSSSSSSFASRWKGTSKGIPPLGHYLLVGSAYAGAVAADGDLSSGITDASSVRLTHAGVTVDEVCYAYTTATSTALMASGYDCPGTPATNPHDDTASSNVAEGLERAPGGAAGSCADTGDSSHDFKTTNPSTPENTSSPATP